MTGRSQGELQCPLSKSKKSTESKCTRHRY